MAASTAASQGEASLLAKLNDFRAEAADIVANTDILLLLTGAGFSADSGLAVNADVEKAPAYAKETLTYRDICQPHLLDDGADLFWRLGDALLCLSRHMKLMKDAEAFVESTDEVILEMPIIADAKDHPQEYQHRKRRKPKTPRPLTEEDSGEETVKRLKKELGMPRYYDPDNAASSGIKRDDDSNREDGQQVKKSRVQAHGRKRSSGDADLEFAGDGNVEKMPILARGLFSVEKMDAAMGRLRKLFNQAIELSATKLFHVKFVKEKMLITRFLDEVARNTGKCCFGVKETMAALDMGAVETLIVWEDLDILRLEIKNPYSGTTMRLEFVTPEQAKSEKLYCDSETGQELDVVDNKLFVKWIVESYKQFGTKLEFITDRSQEGNQFCKGVGGIGGVMRYKVELDHFDEDDFGAQEDIEYDFM